MSRVHDALRRASEDGSQTPKPAAPREPVASRAPRTLPNGGSDARTEGRLPARMETARELASNALGSSSAVIDVEDSILRARRVEFHPLSDALLVNPSKPREAPAEEFRTLRTRLNHIQTQQPLHTLVVTSASPAEGKSFTAANLALTQAQLADKRVLLADFDFRRPTVDKTFQIPIAPGITNYLQGKASLGEILVRVGDSNLYIIPAGDPVPNPLELLNLRECVNLIGDLRNHFDWVILDSPPLLFAADGNLLATMCDGTILVVRIGTTTFDSVTRALQSLCENNVLGTVVNGARRGELYSKYTYYHDYYSYDSDGHPKAPGETIDIEAVKDQDSVLSS
jgi:protein-tyrosine kinase